MSKIRLPRGYSRLVRMDGRVEIQCPHGVGHTSAKLTSASVRARLGKYAMTHGCDGCCVKAEWHLAELALMNMEPK